MLYQRIGKLLGFKCFTFLRGIRSARFFLAVFICMTGTVHAEQTIVVPQLQTAPVLDGDLSDWVTPLTKLDLKKVRPDSSVFVDSVEMFAGYHADTIYFAFRWADSTYDLQHKPYIWDDKQGRYVTGAQREDRLALQFEMEGDYTTNWASGQEFVADMWHWKSSRSAPIGYAHDKTTVVSRSKISKAYKLTNADGVDIYIRRPSDGGDKLYKSMRYGLKEKALMPKYLPNPMVKGSVADVKARSKWSNGYWVVELQRAFDTGYEDDVVFLPGATVKGGVAIFDRSGDDDHVMSQTLSFVIKTD